MSIHIEGRLLKNLFFDADGTFYDIDTQRLIYERPRIDIANHLNTTVDKYVALADQIGSFSQAFIKMGGTQKDYVRLAEVDKSKFLKYDQAIINMLVTLRSHAKLAILTSTTNKSLESIGSTILGDNWRGLFDLIITSDTRGAIATKSNPLIYVQTLSKLKAKPSESAMIGDSHKSDMEPAVAIGMLGVQVENTDSPVAHYKIPSIKHLMGLITLR